MLLTEVIHVSLGVVEKTSSNKYTGKIIIHILSSNIKEENFGTVMIANSHKDTLGLKKIPHT